MASILNFGQKLYAQQTIDAISQPTFGNINISGGTNQTSSILLNSTSTSATIGQRFKVRIEVKTGTVSINEYKLVIEFDTTRLQVIDQDSTVTGNQVRNLDTIFTVPNPQTDNTVSSAGRITVLARASNPSSLNREVIEIEFQAQTTGNAPIRVITGSQGSQLLRSNGSSVPFTSNQVTITLSSANVSGNTGTGTVSAPTTTTSTSNLGTGSLPTTSIGESGGVIGSILGILIIIIGATILSKQKNNKDNGLN